jgi:hypothetical protein
MVVSWLEMGHTSWIVVCDWPPFHQVYFLFILVNCMCQFLQTSMCNYSSQECHKIIIVGILWVILMLKFSIPITIVTKQSQISTSLKSLITHCLFSRCFWSILMWSFNSSFQHTVLTGVQDPILENKTNKFKNLE